MGNDLETIRDRFGGQELLENVLLEYFAILRERETGIILPWEYYEVLPEQNYGLNLLLESVVDLWYNVETPEWTLGSTWGLRNGPWVTRGDSRTDLESLSQV